jgi:hypothetical protein
VLLLPIAHYINREGVFFDKDSLIAGALSPEQQQQQQQQLVLDNIDDTTTIATKPGEYESIYTYNSASMCSATRA